MLGIFKCLALGLCLGNSLRKGVGHEIEILDCCCFCSVAQSCLILCNPMDCNMLNFPVLHHLPEFAQTHVHTVSDVIHHLVLCRPLLLLPSIFPTIKISFNELALRIRWPNIGASAEGEVLPMNIQGWLPLGLTGLISLLSMELSRVFSNTTVQKH